MAFKQHALLTKDWQFASLMSPQTLTYFKTREASQGGLLLLQTQLFRKPQ